MRALFIVVSAPILQLFDRVGKREEPAGIRPRLDRDRCTCANSLSPRTAHVNVAAVAMANKMARIAWAFLTKGE